MAEFGIHPYHQTESASVDLVLVHGLKGNSNDTWAGKDDNGKRTYWPDWIKEAHPDVNIWCVDYDSSLNPWLQSGVPLDQIAGGLLVNALDRGLGARPIHWVGHSMGGLIIKYLLYRSHTRADERQKKLSRVPTTITFLGTPHHGSAVADWKKFFEGLLLALDLPLTGGAAAGGTNLLGRIFTKIRNDDPVSYVNQLSEHSKALGDLNDDFLQWLESAAVEKRLVQSRNYYETLPVKGLVVVVPKRSSQLANGHIIDVAAVGEHHASICKYASVKNAVYGGIESSLRELCLQISGRPLDGGGVPPSPSPSPFPRTGIKTNASDLTDIAWRVALKDCPPDAKLMACRQLSGMLGSAVVAPDALECAIAIKFEASAAECIGSLRIVLHKWVSTPQSNSESQKLFKLYWMLLVRATALACRAAICNANRNDFRVPDQVNRLAITVAAHLVFGQGVEMSFGPAGARVENLIDMAALPAQEAQDPAQPSDYLGLRQEVLRWKERVRGNTPTMVASAKVKGAMAEYEVRPLLLDPKGDMTTQVIRDAARELGIEIVHIEADGCPASIAREDWLDLCDALNNEFENFSARAPQTPTSSSSETVPVAQGSASPASHLSPVQVNLHQTFSGSVGQSNVTTGTGSPIHAHQNQAGGSMAQQESALALAFAGFEMSLEGDATLKGDLHALRDLVVRKDASPSAMHLLIRLLPPLRAVAESQPLAGEAWRRLRHEVRAYWPDVASYL